MPNRNRDTGNQYERDLAKRMRALGFTQCVTSRSESKHRDDQGVDLCYTGPLNIQAKRWKKAPAYHDVLKAMPEEPGQINVIYHKRPHKGEVVVMSASDFEELTGTLVKEELWVDDRAAFAAMARQANAIESLNQNTK